MCTFPVQPICTFSCTAHFISLHILLLILFHYLFLISFSPYLYIYSLVFCFIVFIAFMLFVFYYYFYFLFFCTFNWADLSWLTFHYLLYPVWLCMWQIIKNLEPWTNYCLNSAWHGGDQFVALLRWYGSPGLFDSGLQLICIFWSLVSHFPLDKTP